MKRVNIAAPGFEFDPEDAEGFRAGLARLGKPLGAEDSGISVYELPPGQAVCPYHYEVGEEEWLLVLAGHPTLRHPDGSEALDPWDVVRFPKGPAGAHGIRNESEEPARVLMFSTVVTPTATVYPDSDKVGIWTGDKETDVMVHREANVDYYDGEDGERLVTPTGPGTEVPDEELLRAARGGDEAAFERLLAPYRGELHAHCYRMLGSLHDTEDAMQEALLQVWRNLDSLADRAALRAWLYRIATNACLDLIARRKRRLLPFEYSSAADPNQPPGEPVVESTWIEPYPDEALGVEDGRAAPDADYERREAIELAFVAAMQHLPARQRAVLILREVLGFSAKEVGETLETSVPSVNSALQRARQTVADKIPERSQQLTLRALGDRRMREIVEQYMEAMRGGDVNRIVSMLTEDMAWSMPPLASWYGGPVGGRAEVAEWLRNAPLSGEWEWRHRPTTANGQLAVGTYTWFEPERCFRPFSLDVLTLEGEKIKEVTAFVVRPADSKDGYARWPEYPPSPELVQSIFERRGLPPRLGQISP